MTPGLHSRFGYPVVDELVFTAAQRPNPRLKCHRLGCRLAVTLSSGFSEHLFGLAAFRPWGSHPTGRGLATLHRSGVPRQNPGFLVMGPVVYLLVWPLGFGTCCSFSVEDLFCPFLTWPTILVLKNSGQLSLASLSLPPPCQVSLFWLPRTLSSPLLVPITPLSPGIYLLFHPVCLIHSLA